MKKLEQKGFGPIEIILVVVVVVILGFVGWFVWNQRNVASDKATSDAAKVEQSEEVDATDEDTEEQANTKKYNCNDDFTIEVPKDWYTYHLDNEYEQCTVSNLPKSELPPVGSLSGKNVSFVFGVNEKVSKSLTVWARESATGGYPAEITDEEELTLDNGDKAILIRTEGGHYNTEDYHFYYIKDGVGRATGWRADSQLSDQALESVKTISVQ